MVSALANRLAWYTTSISSPPTTFSEAHSYLEQNVRAIFDRSNALRFKGETAIPIITVQTHILTATRFYVKKNTTLTLSVLSPLSQTITLLLKNNTTGTTSTASLTGSANVYRSHTLNVVALHDYTIALTQSGGLTLFVKTLSDEELYPYIRAYTIASSTGSNESPINASTVTSGTLSDSVLPLSGVTPGTYGTLSNIPILTVDGTGRITGLTVSETIVGGGGGSTDASDLTSGTIPVERLPSSNINASSITTGTLSSNVLEDLVLPFTYGTSNLIPRITVDAKGRITGVSEESLAFSYQNVQGLATVASTGDYNDLVNRTFVLANGANAVFMNGNVGIGVTNPDVTLQVMGTVKASSFEGSFPSISLPDPLYIHVANVGIGTTLPVATFEVNGDIRASSISGPLTPESMPSPFTIISGNVGIGSTQPHAALVVNGGVVADTLEGDLHASNIYGRFSADTVPLPLVLTSSNVTIQEAALIVNTDGNASETGVDILNSGSGNALRIRGPSTDTHFLVKNSGRVAIMHDNPTVELDVNGNIKCHNIACDSMLTTSDLNVTGNFTTINTIVKETDQFTVCNLGTDTALKVYQLTFGSKNVAEFFTHDGSALIITNAGLVGVGSTMPVHDLDVTGDINFTGTLYRNGVVYNPTVDAGQLTTGTLDSARLPASGASAGTYGSAISIPSITVDSKGRITSVASSNVAIPASAISDLALVGKTNNYSSLSNLPLIWSGIHTYYSHAGNLGIGTQVPLRKVDVVGVVRASSFEGNGSNITGIQANNIVGSFSSATIPAPFTIVGANVGIGSTNPIRTLHVQGDINFTGNLYQNNVLFSSTGTSTTQWTKSGNNIYYLVGGGGQGNVGINTTAPVHPLHVFGSAFVSTSGTAGTARTVLTLSAPESTAGTTTQLDFAQGGAITGRIANIYEGPGKIGLAFSAWNSGFAEKMRITHQGNVGIGTTLPLAKLSVQGNIIASGDVGGFGTASDARLKANIRPLNDALDTLNKLQPVEYNWRDDIFNEEKRGTPDVGFIAQDLAPVLPLVLRTLRFPNAPEDYQGIAYEKIVPYLVKAVQELSSQLEATQKQVKSLMAQRM